MSWGLVAGAAIAVGGSVYSSSQAKKGAKSAAAAESAASEAGIAEQRRQFDEVQKLLSPYVQAGTPAINQQQELLGLKGNKAQQALMQSLAKSPEMQAYIQQGENAMLQNASATGGLRGGNMQAALAQFRPQLLNQMINQRFTNLGGLTSIGQASAAGVGNAGMQSANNIGNLLQAQGQAQAGGAMARSAANANIGNSIAQFGSAYLGKQFGNGGLSQGVTPGSLNIQGF